MPPSPAEPTPSRKPATARTQEEAWDLLLVELTKLNTQLEYIKLMLKLGVRKI